MTLTLEHTARAPTIYAPLKPPRCQCGRILWWHDVTATGEDGAFLDQWAYALCTRCPAIYSTDQHARPH